MLHAWGRERRKWPRATKSTNLLQGTVTHSWFCLRCIHLRIISHKECLLLKIVRHLWDAFYFCLFIYVFMLWDAFTWGLPKGWQNSLGWVQLDVARQKVLVSWPASMNLLLCHGMIKGQIMPENTQNWSFCGRTYISSAISFSHNCAVSFCFGGAGDQP